MISKPTKTVRAARIRLAFLERFADKMAESAEGRLYLRMISEATDGAVKWVDGRSHLYPALDPLRNIEMHAKSRPWRYVSLSHAAAVVKARCVITENGCWEYQPPRGKGHPSGYNQIKLEGRSRMVHRVTYENAKGLVPDGLELDHLCRNPRCCNPDHLEAVTRAVNQMRSPLTTGGKNAAKTHCPQGHPYDEANTVVMQGGHHRGCRTCMRDSRKRKAAERKAAKAA